MTPLVSPAGAADLMLSGVSCARPGICAAVGTYTAEGAARVLLERFNGVRWSLEPAPALAGATNVTLTAVSCATGNACTAVGSAFIPARDTNVALAIGWNGRDWSVQAGADPVGGTPLGFTAVSCGGPTSCTAIGYFFRPYPDFGPAALVEHWNGRRWSREQVSPTVDAMISQATLISCGSPASCTVIGPRAPIMHWNGKTWSIDDTTSGLDSSGQLHGLSCPTAASCTAVGGTPQAYYYHASLAVHWDGRVWSVQPTPNHLGVANADLMSVSCASASACAAVGTYVNPAGRQVPLAELWNGRMWTAQPIAGPANAQLTGVSCPSTTICTAVGWVPGRIGGHETLLAEVGKGRAWSTRSVPSPAGARNIDLAAVSCTSPTACTAVGSYDKPPRDGLTLAERWDGSHWSIQPTPSPPSAGTMSSPGHALTSVSCSSRTACTAVGSYYGNIGPLTLAEHWNGSDWSIQPTPNAHTGIAALHGAPIGELDGVSCPTATSCVASGSADEGMMLSERWNGSSWSILPIPSLGTYSFLSSISCATQTTCVAVGFADSSPEFVESWDGTNWSLQPTPGPLYQGLSSVSCPTTNDCVVAVQSA